MTSAPMRAIWRLVSIVAAAGLCAGCGYLDGLSRPEAPTELSQRTALPNCGDVDLHGPSPTTEEMYPQSAVDCLNSAAGGEFVLTLPTTDGDPITTYFRASPGTAAVEVWVDQTLDGYGSRGWQRRDCANTDISAAELRRCASSG